MNEKFIKVLKKFVMLYLDDILIFSESREEHEEHVREVLQILRENNI
jgi:Reverse transcriptase (RNA-dependent DNA polymerase)